MSLPTDASGLTPEWLSAAMAPRYPGVRVGSVEVLERHSGTNQHVRLALGYDAQAGAPDSVFCKLPPFDAQHGRNIDATGMGSREVAFYTDLAPHVSMRIPTAHAAAATDDGAFVLVIEDLAARGCAISDGSWGIPGDVAARAIEDLAELHVRYQDPARLAAIAPWTAVTRPKSTDFVVRTLRHVVEHCRDVLSDAYLAVAEMYIDHHSAIDAVWSSGPHTFIHYDPHIGNLFIDDGRVGFLDWGMSKVATPMRDVSYFMTMAMDSDDRRRDERDLVRHYVDVRRSLGGVELGFDEAWLAHRLHAGYGVIASFLTLVPPYNTEVRRMFTTAFRARAMAALDDLDTVTALRDAIA